MVKMPESHCMQQKINLNHLFQQRDLLYSIEKKSGLFDYSEIERSVIEFVHEEEAAHIDMIVKHPYFEKSSLSTINRVVSKLKKDGVLDAFKIQSKDNRITFLKVSDKFIYKD